MIRHIVCCRWAPTAHPDQIEQVSEALSGLPDQIDAIAAYRFGPDLGLAEGNWDFSVTADFVDEAGYVTYRDHDVHQAVIRDRIAPIVAERAAVQIHLDD